LAPTRGSIIGVEPICAQLKELGCGFAPSSYYEARSRPESRRALRDKDLKAAILKEYDENYRCYGVRKMWLEFAWQGHRRGALHGGAVDEDPWPARGPPREGEAHDGPDPAATRAQDRVKRNFCPLAPNKLWVADFTYVSTLAGWVYVAFVIDAYARRVLG